MQAKYGFIDANYYLFECTLNDEHVEDRCNRGNDLDGWVDLFPVDEEGHLMSVCPERKWGEVGFTNVRLARGVGPLVSHLVEQVYELREQLAKLRLEFNVLQNTNATLPDLNRVRGDVRQLREDLAREPALEG